MEPIRNDFPVPRLIAIDLDGTLLNSRKAISAANRAALLAARERAHVVIATARPPRSVVNLCGDLGLVGPTICYNGALTVELPHSRTLGEWRVDPEVGREVVEGLLQQWPGTWLSFEIDDQWWTDREPAQALVESAKLFPPNRIAPVSDFLGAAFHKIYTVEQPETTRAMLDWLRATFNGCIQTVLAEGATLLQIVHPDAGKGAAVRVLAEQWNVPREQVMTLGDEWNDLDMLEWAGLGVAMGNADDDLKARCAAVTGHHDDDGVAKALERYLLSREPADAEVQG